MTSTMKKQKSGRSYNGSCVGGLMCRTKRMKKREIPSLLVFGEQNRCKVKFFPPSTNSGDNQINSLLGLLLGLLPLPFAATDFRTGPNRFGWYSGDARARATRTIFHKRSLQNFNPTLKPLKFKTSGHLVFPSGTILSEKLFLAIANSK
jgi:hypothetical protein